MSVGIISTNIKGMGIYNATVDLGSVAANTSEEETFTLTGVKIGDFVSVQKNDLSAGIILGSARVEADDVVTVEVVNSTGSAVDAASATMKVFVARFEGQATDLPTNVSF